MTLKNLFALSVMVLALSACGGGSSSSSGSDDQDQTDNSSDQQSDDDTQDQTDDSSDDLAKSGLPDNGAYLLDIQKYNSLSDFNYFQVQGIELSEESIPKKIGGHWTYSSTDEETAKSVWVGSYSDSLIYQGEYNQPYSPQPSFTYAETSLSGMSYADSDAINAYAISSLSAFQNGTFSSDAKQYILTESVDETNYVLKGCLPSTTKDIELAYAEYTDYYVNRNLSSAARFKGDLVNDGWVTFAYESGYVYFNTDASYYSSGYGSDYFDIDTLTVGGSGDIGTYVSKEVNAISVISGETQAVTILDVSFTYSVDGTVFPRDLTAYTTVGIPADEDKICQVMVISPYERTYRPLMNKVAVEEVADALEVELKNFE